MNKPLNGLRVIDLTHVLAGPYCTYQLGMLGAEVIKIEAPDGDMVRYWGGEPAQIELGLGTGFTAQNAGKRSCVVDIHQPEGAQLVRELVATADVFVENYRPGAMARYGLDYSSLSAQRADLVYVSISAFGQDGPEGHRPGFDDVVQATSGFMSINVRGDGPIRTGGPVLDYATGMHAASAVLAALMVRQQTGEGQRVDVAMQDVTMLLMNRNSSIAASTGVPVPPAQNRDGFLLGRYATADGYVMLAGYRPSHQRSILAALGLATYADLGGRELLAQRELIEAAVERRLAEHPSAYWDQVFARAGVVAGGVRDLIEVFASGQPEARELFQDASSAYGVHRVSTAGYKLGGQTLGPGNHVPQLGEHTDVVLSELGYAAADLKRLRDAGVIQ